MIAGSCTAAANLVIGARLALSARTPYNTSGHERPLLWPVLPCPHMAGLEVSTEDDCPEHRPTAAVLAGHHVLFKTWAELLLDLGAQESARGLVRRLNHLATRGLLLIDEIGDPSYDARAADLLFPGRELPRRTTEPGAHHQLIVSETNRSSVPFTLIGQTVEVQRRGGHLVLTHRGQRVTEHDELPGEHQVRVLPEHGAGASARATRRAPRGPRVGAADPGPDVKIRDLPIYEMLGLTAVPA